jgi:hypothetical protein
VIINLARRDHQEDQDTGGRIVLKMGRREFGWSDMAWIDLIQNMDQWSALVNTAMKLRVP